MRNKAVYVALGVRADGTKEIFSAYGSSRMRGAKFWLRVMNELKTRGVEDILIAIVDGLKGFPEAIVAVFSPSDGSNLHRPSLLRHSLEFASYKDRKAVAAALKDIYCAIGAASGEAALAAFEASPWGRKYPAIGQSWRRAWAEVVPFYAFHPDVRLIGLYDQRYPGAELKTPQSRPRQRAFSNRRSGDEIAISGLEPIGERVDHAGT